MRWNVRRTASAADYPPGTGRWWVSEQHGTMLGRRYHDTHAEALQRAIVKAYGPQPRKATTP